jgi:hypothetical protein
MSNTLVSTSTGWEAFDEGRALDLCMIPGIPGTKKTFVKWTPYQERKPTDDEVAEWREKYPRISPVFITGKVSERIVVDQDGVIGYCELRKRGPIPHTVTVETPRGKFHWHYWFKYPEGIGTIHNFASGYSDSDDIPDVDLRGDGGIAVFPGGTNKEGKLYRFKEGCSPADVPIADAPDWLIEYIKAHNERLRQQEEAAEFARNSVVMRLRSQQVGSREKASRMQRYAEAALRRQIDKIASCDKGGRNNQLNKSSYAMGPFLNEGIWTDAELYTLLERAAIDCGLDKDPNCGMAGIRRTIESGLRAGRRNRVTLNDSPQYAAQRQARP